MVAFVYLLKDFKRFIKKKIYCINRHNLNNLKFLKYCLLFDNSNNNLLLSNLYKLIILYLEYLFLREISLLFFHYHLIYSNFQN